MAGFKFPTWAEFRKQLALSLVCLLVTIPASVIGQKVLAETHLLDPAAQWISDRIVNVGPNTFAWIVALLVGLGLYIGAHRRLSLQAETTPVASLETKFISGEMPIWKAVEHVRAVIGDNDEDNCYPEARRQLRQAAERGSITLSGRKELPPPKADGHASEIWTEIEKGYWQDHQLNALATGALYADHDHTQPEPLVVDGYRRRYWSVKAKKAEIEGGWPRSANVGFDTTFHHLVLHVAIRSKWAGSFAPNVDPDWLTRLLNDPWDALKQQICGPLVEGRLHARGIRKPPGQPKENSFSDVPQGFWRTAQFDVKNLLLSRKASGASGEGGLFLGVIFRNDEIAGIWPERSDDEIRGEPSPFVQLAKELQERTGDAG